MNPIAFEVGPFAIRWYGVLIASAILLGTFLALREAARKGVNSDHLLNLILIIIPFAFIGARLYYVIFSWKDYIANPWEVLAVWHGGLAIHGGIIGGVLAGYWYIRKHHLEFWTVADIIAPSLVLGQAIGRWGNFINQEAHGGPVSREFISKFPGFIQKGMLINGSYYHPTFFYESTWDLAVFFFLLWLSKKSKFNGIVALCYLILYSAGRFFVEGLRTDSLMLGPFRVAQLVSLGAIIIAGFILFWRIRRDI